MWADKLAEAARLAQGPDPARAEPVIDWLLAERPGHPDALTVAGIAAQRMGQGDAAIAAFAEACDADSANPARQQNLAIALKNAGHFDAAIESFGRALALRPGHPATLANLGSCLIAADRPGDAAEILSRAVAAESGNVEAHNNLGVAQARTGRFAEAAASYRRALTIRPDHRESALNLADALVALGHADEAAGLFRRVLSALPADVRAANQLGLLCERGGNFAEARGILRAAFGATTNHALGVNLARVLIRAGDAEEAVTVCDTLIASDPSMTTPLALKLSALDRLGRDADRDALMAADRFVTVIDDAGLQEDDSFDAALVAELRAHPSLTFEPEGLVTRQGRQSADLADSSSPAIRRLADMARRELGRARERLGAQAADHPFLRALPHDWTLTLWGTILQPGGEVGPHIHAPNWLSGVYYPEFAAPAANEDPDAGAFALGLLPAELGGGGTPRVYQPARARMILFPSYLWHATLPFAGEHERISFAFDLVPAGIGRPHRLD